jgi:hypothetical protein
MNQQCIRNQKSENVLEVENGPESVLKLHEDDDIVASLRSAVCDKDDDDDVVECVRSAVVDADDDDVVVRVEFEDSENERAGGGPPRVA